MKVIVSSYGKFHAFRLAEELEKRGHLHRLLTGYYSGKRSWLPVLRRDSEQISTERVKTNFLPLFLDRGLSRIPKIGGWSGNYAVSVVFDRWAERQVDPCDLVTAWSGFALLTLRKAKAVGAVTVLERGSSHILFQKILLEEEYAKYGNPAKPVDDRICKKELLEYQEADYISVPSRFAMRSFLEKGFAPEKLIQVPYGIDLSRFYPRPKEDGIFRIIHCGGLTLQKGVHYLLQAFFELNLPNSELWLVGNWSQEIAPFLQKYNNGRVVCKGHFPEKDLAFLYSQSSVFCLASIQEGLALALLQAMACALPVIATTHTGVEDLIDDGEHGFIIGIRDVNALKDKILYLYQQTKERKQMGEAAVRRAKEFTWNCYGEKITMAYKNAVDRKQNQKR